MADRVLGKFLREHESKELLQKYGIKVAKSFFTVDENSAVEIAEEIGYPVVMKVSGDNIIHKSKVGGVILDIKDEKGVRGSFRRLMKISGVDGVTIQPMVEKGVEVAIGVSSDRFFGKILMFGLGGIFIEAIRDVAFRLIPLTDCDAEEMISEIKGYKLLKNKDVKAVKELILKISEISEKEKIVEMDLNPIFVYSEGYVVVDARMWIM